MDAIRVGRDERSGGLEGVPEAYRPIPHGKRRDGHCTNPFSERLRRERGRDPRAPTGPARRAPGGGERLAAAGVDGRQHDRARLPAPRASASSVLTPTIGSPRACASARAVAIPIRRPVKLPGPTPTASRSSASQPTPAASSASSAAASSRAGVRRPHPRRGIVAHLEDRIVNQNARHRRRGRGIEPEHDHDDSTRRSPPACASATCRATGRSPSSASSPRRSGHSTNVIELRPEVGIEQPGILVVEPREPVQVEVRDARLVEVPDHERRARHRLGHPERPRRAAHERRLAGAELARDQHDVTGRERRGERRAGALGLLGRRGLATRLAGHAPAAPRPPPGRSARASRAAPRPSPCAGAAPPARVPPLRSARRPPVRPVQPVPPAWRVPGPAPEPAWASRPGTAAARRRTGRRTARRPRSAPPPLAGSSASSIARDREISTPTPHALEGRAHRRSASVRRPDEPARTRGGPTEARRRRPCAAGGVPERPRDRQGDRPRRRDDGREPRRRRLHGHLHAHPRHRRLRLAGRAAQPHRDPVRPGLRAAGRRRARGDARPARPRRRARRHARRAGAATSSSRWWASPSCPCSRASRSRT